MKKLLLVILTCSTLSVFAQSNKQTIERKGFVIGLGIGGGIISVSDNSNESPFDKTQGGTSLPNLKVGWMLNPKMTILVTMPGMIYEIDGYDRSFEGVIPTFQYWPTNKWWINAGFGLAMDFPVFYQVDEVRNESWNFGKAVTMSTGYELVQKENFALDLHSRLYLGRVSLDDGSNRDAASFTLGVGFTWF